MLRSNGTPLPDYKLKDLIEDLSVIQKRMVKVDRLRQKLSNSERYLKHYVIFLCSLVKDMSADISRGLANIKDVSNRARLAALN